MLDALVDKIRAVEARYALGRGAAALAARADEPEARFSTGWPAVDAALDGGLEAGGLHEWFGPFSPSATRTLWTPPLCLMCHLGWQAFEGGGAARWSAWVGKACFPYPQALVRDDSADRRLLERSLFIAASDTAARLWAIDSALRCQAIGAVIADGREFNMAATRRIHLVARAHDAAALLVRPAEERRKLSAAQTRWLVSPLAGVSEAGRPRWRIELLRHKGARPISGARTWSVEWDHEQSVVGLSAALPGEIGAAPATAGERVFQRHSA